jgi:Rieske Fe-S protein
VGIWRLPERIASLRLLGWKIRQAGVMAVNQNGCIEPLPINQKAYAGVPMGKGQSGQGPCVERALIVLVQFPDIVHQAGGSDGLPKQHTIPGPAQGCQLGKAISEARNREIWCACHNGTYDLEGRVASGPPPKPLEELAVKVRCGVDYALNYLILNHITGNQAQ